MKFGCKHKAKVVLLNSITKYLMISYENGR